MLGHFVQLFGLLRVLDLLVQYILDKSCLSYFLFPLDELLTFDRLGGQARWLQLFEYGRLQLLLLGLLHQRLNKTE